MSRQIKSHKLLKEFISHFKDYLSDPKALKEAMAELKCYFKGHGTMPFPSTEAACSELAQKVDFAKLPLFLLYGLKEGASWEQWVIYSVVILAHQKLLHNSTKNKGDKHKEALLLDSVVQNVPKLFFDRLGSVKQFFADEESLSMSQSFISALNSVQGEVDNYVEALFYSRLKSSGLFSLSFGALAAVQTYTLSVVVFVSVTAFCSLAGFLAYFLIEELVERCIEKTAEMIPPKQEAREMLHVFHQKTAKFFQPFTSEDGILDPSQTSQMASTP